MVRRHRHPREGSDSSSVGSNARGGDGATEKIRVGGTDHRLRRRELEVVFSLLLEQSRNGDDVNGGIRIGDDDVIEVGSLVDKTFNAFVDHLDEPSRRRAAPLWHDQPLEARERGECRERDRVFVNRYLVE